MEPFMQQPRKKFVKNMDGKYNVCIVLYHNDRRKAPLSFVLVNYLGWKDQEHYYKVD